MKRKGFIFDLDGVIVDTAKYHYLAWKRLADSLGIAFSEGQNEQLKGVSRVKSLQKILAWGHLEITTQEFDELMARKNDEYLDYISKMDTSEVLPDVPRVLNFLQQQNQPIALGSASKNARTILGIIDLFDKFDAIVDGTNVSNAKPDPEVFLNAAAQLNLPASECIVFEDSLAGIEAANSAGMVSIGIGKLDVLFEADYIFSGFTEISNEFILELINK